MQLVDRVLLSFLSTVNNLLTLPFSFFLLWVCFRNSCLSLSRQQEIYRIVSQKQLRDPSEEDGGGPTIRPNNVETINVKPTVSTDNVRKQCCNS